MTGGYSVLSAWISVNMFSGTLAANALMMAAVHVRLPCIQLSHGVGCSHTVLVRDLCSFGVLHLLLRILEQVAGRILGKADDNVVESRGNGHSDGGKQ